MSGQRYTPEFKDEAVKQVLDRGFSIAQVAERLAAKYIDIATPPYLDGTVQRIHRMY